MQIRIGKLAEIAGCPVVTIRFYEKEGLLPRPQRGPNNYRVYAEDDIERLRFILHCRRHGISLSEIRHILAFRTQPTHDCVFVHELIKKHLQQVEEQIISLNELKAELESLNGINNCAGQCSILQKLGAPDSCPYCQDLECRLKK